MKNILVISGHPDLKNSIGNATILNELEKHFGNDIEIRRLNELYPDYRIDVKKEQEALVKSDIIVLQFPIFWYNVPALLKKWIDDVFEHGFAYGSKGKALHGKKLLLSFTAGADEKEYTEELNHDLPDFMPAFMETSDLCGMIWQEPVYSYAVLNIPGMSNEEDINRAKDIAIKHTERLVNRLEELV